MSWVLRFAAKGAAPSAEDVDAYLKSRRHHDGLRRYDNPETGVSFGFESNGAHIAVLELNYNRPFAFALEAAEEVAAFLEAFDLEVDDPQDGGMGTGPFSREAMLCSWQRGNDLFTAALADAGGVLSSTQSAYGMERSKLRDLWWWNYRRVQTQNSLMVEDEGLIPLEAWVLVERLQRELVVPVRTVALAGSDEVKTSIELEGGPCAIMEADYVFHRRTGQLIPWSTVAPSVEGFGQRLKLSSGVEAIVYPLGLSAGQDVLDDLTPTEDTIYRVDFEDITRLL